MVDLVVVGDWYPSSLTTPPPFVYHMYKGLHTNQIVVRHAVGTASTVTDKVTWQEFEPPFFTTVLQSALVRNMRTNRPSQWSGLSHLPTWSDLGVDHASVKVNATSDPTQYILVLTRPIGWIKRDKFEPDPTSWSSLYNDELNVFLKRHAYTMPLTAWATPTQPVNSYTFRVGPLVARGGEGMIAWAMWCALVRKIRSTHEAFAQFTRDCRVSPLADASWRAWPVDTPLSTDSIRAVLTLLVREHVRYVASISEENKETKSAKESSSSSSYVRPAFPALVLPHDPRQDTPFQDMYRFWKRADANNLIRDNAATTEQIMLRMVRQTLMHPCYAVVCTESAGLPCRVVWRVSAAHYRKMKLKQPSAALERLPLYSFIDYDDVEENMSVAQLVSLPLEQAFRFRIRTTSLDPHAASTTKHVNMHRFTAAYRDRDAQWSGPHALWSFTRDAKDYRLDLPKSGVFSPALVRTSIVCGGMGNFVDHHCADSTHTIEKENLSKTWFVAPTNHVLARSTFQPGDEITLQYDEHGSPGWYDFVHGNCMCPSCRRSSGGKKWRVMESPQEQELTLDDMKRERTAVADAVEVE